MKFEKEVLQQIRCDDMEGFELVKDEITSTSRWSIYHYMIFKDDKGNYYGVEYSEGATEMQAEIPWEYEPDLIDVDELRETQTVVTTYCGKVNIKTPFEITMERFDKALYHLSTEDMNDSFVREQIQSELIEIYETLKGMN